MNGRAACAAFVSMLCLQSFAARFALEWNPRYRAQIPYEVEIDRDRLGIGKDEGFRIGAWIGEKERLLDVVHLPALRNGAVRLRFTPPKDTLRLICETERGTGKTVASSTVDNIFAGAVDSGAETRWVCSGAAGVRVTGMDGGMLLEGTRSGRGEATFSAEVPGWAAGCPARFELDIKSLSSLAWGNVIHVFQMDAKGNRLPEEVVEARWISHARAPGTETKLRENAFIHPKAARVRISFELRDADPAYDAYGLPVKDAGSTRAKLAVTHIALRPAEALPFPKWNDGFFGKGVSGAAGDTSLRLGAGRAFFFNTHSQACWSDGVQLRDERDCFYPFRDGTVEAWLKPEWTSASTNGVRIFEASHHLSSVYPGLHQSLGVMLSLDYDHGRRVISAFMKDVASQVFGGSGAVAIPEGEWCHVAMQWRPGGEAEVFVGGRRIFTFPLAGYKTVDFANKRNRWPNDMMPLEFFLGGGYESVRQTRPEALDRPYLCGEADLLRVSSGKRYADGFIPDRSFSPDGNTRALFGFDRSFDGISGGGVGRITSSVLAPESLVAGHVATDCGDVKYRPDSLSADRDPGKIFDPVNHAELPAARDFKMARRRTVETFRFSPGDVRELHCPQSVKMDYVEIVNTGRTPLVHPVVLREGEIDPRSAGDLADSLGRSYPSPRAKVDRLFSFLMEASDYFMNHTVRFDAGSDVPYGAASRPMTLLNSYCGFECGPLNDLVANFFTVVGGCSAGVVPGYGHVFEQVHFDGRNHLYDLTFQTFFPSWDNETPASLADCEREPGIFARTPRAVCDNFIRLGSRRHYFLGNPDYPAKIGVTLNPGERFRVWWANDGNMNDLQISNRAQKDRMRVAPKDDYTEICGAKPRGENRVWRIDRFFPYYGSGFISRSGRPLRDDAAFNILGATGFTYRVTCPYPIVAGVYSARLRNGRHATLDFSTDRGRTFRPLPADKDGISRPDYLVRGRHEYLIRVNAPLADVDDFAAETGCMVNLRVFPGRLQGGKNRLVCKATSKGEGRVTIAYRSDSHELHVKGSVFSGAIPGEERELIVIPANAARKFEVVGASPQTTVKASAGLNAALADGTLRLSSRSGPQPRFEHVLLEDGGAERGVTVLVSSGARLLLPSMAEVKGGSIRYAAGGDGIQDCVLLRNAGDEARFSCEAHKTDSYHIFVLERFRAHVDGSKKPVAEFSSDGCKPVPVCHPVNDGCDYYLAKFGKPGGRGNFKWDFPYMGGTGHPFREVRRTYMRSAGAFDLRLKVDVPDGLEIAAVLVVPAYPREFRVQMLKLLCGFNCDPWRVSAVR